MSIAVVVDCGDGPVLGYNRSESNAVSRVLNRLHLSGRPCPETMEEIFTRFGTAYDRRVYNAYVKKQKRL